MAKRFLCWIGAHKWLKVLRPNPSPETVWLFGPLVTTGEWRCAHCKQTYAPDLTTSDYD